MKVADLPENESERLQALLDYQIMDTPEEETYDELTELASSICQKPIALISLIDEHRQWFKSHHGLDARETPRDFAFCAHAILEEGVFEVKDSSKDIRFHDNPLAVDAPDVIYYAGAPLTTPQGYNIGTLCVIDNKPGELSAQQKRQLELIAKQAIAQLELRKNGKEKTALFNELKKLSAKQDQENKELYQFSHRVAHDLKAPLSNIQSFIDLSLKDLEKNDFDNAMVKYRFIKEGSQKARTLISDLLDLTKAELFSDRLQEIDFSELIKSVINNLQQCMEMNEVKIEYAVNTAQPFTSEETRLRQILSNLISNSVKYSDPEKETKSVMIRVEESPEGVMIYVQDNGLGIPDQYQDKIFDTFTRFHTDVSHGSGIGTTIVKKHVDTLGGSIELKSDNKLTEFTIYLPQSEA